MSAKGSPMNRKLIFIILTLLSGNLAADSLRCGSKLVKTGDSSNTLINKCGNPVRTFNTYETINDHGRRYEASVSNWVYERSGKKDMIVTIRKGEVLNIRPD
jgi:hypothetical protein